MAETTAPLPKTKTDLSFIHGEYVKIDDQSDAYVGFLKSVETGELTMRIVDNPVVNIWITSPQYRTYTHKREWSSKTELDEYTTRYLFRGETIWNALHAEETNGRWRHMRYVNLRKEMSSPFVFGADIDFGVRMKYRYQKLNGDRKPLAYNVGHLDIENDVNGTNDVILITFINGDGNTYTGILKQFFQNHTTEELEKLWKNKVEPGFEASLNKKARKFYDKAEKLKLHCKIFDNEVELIKWVFDNIHNCRPDFVTIWNMNHDIPYIMDRLKFRGVDPTDIFCSPDIPKKYRRCWYKKDESADHIVDNWSWFHCTDYTRYIDAMCCYGRIRKAKPREPSYRLDLIGGKEVGTGKLQIYDEQTVLDHHVAQLECPLEYSVYNIVDVLLLRAMELKNNDCRTMMMLIGDSMLEDFAKQSAQLKNMFFVYLDSLNGVVSSVGEPLDVPWDKYQTNKGGQVLSPDRTRGTGVSILVDTDLISFVHKLVCDIDVSSIN